MRHLHSRSLRSTIKFAIYLEYLHFAVRKPLNILNKLFEFIEFT